MPNPFNITAATNTIRLDDKGQAQTTFTVFNNSGRAMRGRARVSPQDPASESWITLVGEAERDFPIAGTQDYNVKVAVPAGSPPGSYPFRLDAVGTENPDEEYSQGPTVTFDVLAAAPVKKPFPIWIPIVIVVALLVVGGVIAFLATRGDDTASANATATATAITATALAQAGADQTSTAVALAESANATATANTLADSARATQTAVASSTYDFIANADNATWRLSVFQETGSYTSTLDFQFFTDGSPDGFAIWRDSRYKLNDGSTASRFLEASPPRGTSSGTIEGCYAVRYPSGAKVQPADRISGKIGFIEGPSDGAAAFYIYVLAGPEHEVAVFADVHNYSEGVRAFDVPVGANLTGQEINTICLGVASSGLTSPGTNPSPLAAASWIDVKLTRK